MTSIYLRKVPGGLKRCKRCGLHLPLSDFYEDARMVSGRINFCKPCVRSRARERRQNDLDRYRARELAYARSRHGKKVRRIYAMSKKGREIAKQSSANWRDANGNRVRAHAAVNNAVAQGKLEKPSTCSQCGSAGVIHGHHEDYSRPLDVVWFCARCHKDVHTQ